MRAGIIPTLLGTAVTGATLYMNGEDLVKRGKKKRNIESMVATGLLGFGIAHVVLGSINMMKNQ
ncbi:MAG: asparagine synthase [Tissierellia bacterium]|jgi:hypothetical protein|nr:asparagine synthase [Tissierellia bacterium]